MFDSLFKKKDEGTVVYSPANGVFIKGSDIHDEVFSKGFMGETFAVKPDDNLVYSPLDGEVSMVFPTKHALGIKTKSGIECIVHIGVDTVNLKGEGFEILVKEGDKVSHGTKIAKVDFDFIRGKDLHDDVIVALQNTKNFEYKDIDGKLSPDTVVAHCEKE